MSDVLEEKNKRYIISDELKILGDKIISDKNMSITPEARIKYVLVYPHINKKTAGRCISARPMVKLFGECDYIIQLSGEFYDKLDDKRKEILMYHELLHVLPIMNQKTGNWDFRIRDHDINDFQIIIDAYGINWINELKTLFSSVYDIDNLDQLGL